MVVIKMKTIILSIVAFVFAAVAMIGSASAAPNPGAIWTTYEDCGNVKQDANHYAVGDKIYINGAGFNPGTYDWFIIGKPGHASSDPGKKVAVGKVNVSASGAFCFDAYTVASDDDGEYGVSVGKKSDNYRVIGAGLTCEEAIEQGLLRANIEGNTVHVINEASDKYEISFISYQIYSGNVFDQTPFDWVSAVVINKHKILKIDVPDCAYQLDLVCGKPMMDNPEYGQRVIESTFENLDNYCTQSDASSGPGISTELSIAPSYPQNRTYVFFCNATGFTPTNYSWYFGDGALQVGYPNNNIFHTYINSGEYTAACRAMDGTDWGVDTLDIIVS